MTMHSRRRGFTLLEITMVLMVVGIVAAAIWVAAQRVMINYRVARVNEQVLKIVQNVRDYYGISFTALPFGTATDITQSLDLLLAPPGNVEIFPEEMRRDPTLAPGSASQKIDHALNNSLGTGSLHVFAETGITGVTTFRLQLLGLTTATCIQLLMSEPMTNDSVRFLRFATVGGSTPTPVTINWQPSFSTTPLNYLPMTVTHANTWCAGATEVDFDFGIRN